MSWYEYTSAAEKKKQTARAIAQRVKRGETFEPFQAPAGTKLVKTFWGQAWCGHLETYCGYETRLPRGRSYLRQGNVYNLKVEKGQITAEVTGSEIYEVEITIPPLPADKWKAIRKRCEGQVASLLDLLSGKLGDGVMKIVSDPAQGLFPSRREIKHFCSCPDAADLCKHRAAVLYGVGVLFDRDPKFLFELRGADPSELIATSAASLTSSAGSAANALEDDDLSALFGIDLSDPEPAAPAPALAKPKVKAVVNSQNKAKAKAKSKVPGETLAGAVVKTAAKRPAKTAGSAKKQTTSPPARLPTSKKRKSF